MTSGRPYSAACANWRPRREAAPDVLVLPPPDPVRQGGLPPVRDEAAMSDLLVWVDTNAMALFVVAVCGLLVQWIWEVALS